VGLLGKFLGCSLWGIEVDFAWCWSSVVHSWANGVFFHIRIFLVAFIVFFIVMHTKGCHKVEEWGEGEYGFFEDEGGSFYSCWGGLSEVLN